MVSNDDIRFITQQKPDLILREFPPTGTDGGYLFMTVPSGKKWNIKIITGESDSATIITIFLRQPAPLIDMLLYQSAAAEKFISELILNESILLEAGIQIGINFKPIGSSYAYYLKILVNEEEII